MPKSTFAICLQNNGYEASLERCKLYRILPDTEAEQHDQLRVIDESGDDYLYPKGFFAVVDLPEALEQQILRAA